MMLRFFGLPVIDQNQALEFYTGKLGFKKAADFDMGNYRFLTVIPPDGKVEGNQLALETFNFPQAQELQKAKFDAGQPALSLITKNVKADYDRIKSIGVTFRGQPKNLGLITSVLFEDTCGNLINLVESHR